VNLILTFIHPTRPARTLGPFSELWFDAEALRDRPDGPVLARHVRHQWEVEGLSYYRLDCTARVTVRFHGRRSHPSRAFGAFDRFSAVDGLVYTDNKVFAHLDEPAAAWLCYDLGEHWPVMVVAEVAARGGALVPSALLALAPLAAGAYGLFNGAEPVYVGRANGGVETVRSRLAEHLTGKSALDPQRISAVVWSAHSDPVAEEARLLKIIARLASTVARAQELATATQRMVMAARELKARARRARAAARASRDYKRATIR
jgi:hypothetical protein